MIIFVNSESTIFSRIRLRIKRFIHKRKVVHFLLPRGVVEACLYTRAVGDARAAWIHRVSSLFHSLKIIVDVDELR